MHYIDSEAEAQIKRMKQLGINTTGQMFEQMVTSLLVLAESQVKNIEILRCSEDFKCCIEAQEGDRCCKQCEVCKEYHKKQLDIQRVSGSLTDILKAQTDFKLANEIKEIQAKEVFNYIVNEHGVKLTYEEWRKTVKAYYR